MRVPVILRHRNHYKRITSNQALSGAWNMSAAECSRTNGCRGIDNFKHSWMWKGPLPQATMSQHSICPYFPLLQPLLMTTPPISVFQTSPCRLETLMNSPPAFCCNLFLQINSCRRRRRRRTTTTTQGQPQCTAPLEAEPQKNRQKYSSFKRKKAQTHMAAKAIKLGFGACFYPCDHHRI